MRSTREILHFVQNDNVGVDEEPEAGLRGTRDPSASLGMTIGRDDGKLAHQGFLGGDQQAAAIWSELKVRGAHDGSHFAGPTIRELV